MFSFVVSTVAEEEKCTEFVITGCRFENHVESAGYFQSSIFSISCDFELIAIE